MTATNFALSGLVSSQSFTVTKTTGAYNSADVVSATTVSTSLVAGDFTAGAGTLASNYDFPTSASGSGHIIKATPVVTWATPADITYGTALGATQLNASSGTVAGTFTYTPVSGTVLNAGLAQVLSVHFVPTDTANYTPAPDTTVLINVHKATLTASIIGIDEAGPHDAERHVDGDELRAERGLVSSQSFTVTKTTGAYNSADVVSATTVSTSLVAGDFTAGAGTLASNYDFPTSASGSATSSRRRRW